MKHMEEKLSSVTLYQKRYAQHREITSYFLSILYGICVALFALVLKVSENIESLTVHLVSSNR